MKNIDIESVLIDVSELFKVLGDSTRIRILHLLRQKEKNVTEIAEELNMNQSAISHQLRILKNSKLVKSPRGKDNVLFPERRSCYSDSEYGN